MPRKRGPGGGKSEKTLTYKPSVEGLERFEAIRQEHIAETPALANVAVSDWVGDYMGFTIKSLIRPSDRLRLRRELTLSEREQVDHLSQIAEAWPDLSERDQKLYAVRIDSLLKDVRAKASSNGGTINESSRSVKQARRITKEEGLKSKSA